MDHTPKGARQETNPIVAFGAMGATTQTFGQGGVAAKSSTGVYTLTLDDACAAAECIVVITPRGSKPSAGQAHAVTHTSDTVKTVHWTAGEGTYTDTAFDWFVMKKG